jgi:L-ribulose-5-phosphate 3-epimerase
METDRSRCVVQSRFRRLSRVLDFPISVSHCWPDEMSSQSRVDGKQRLDGCGATVRSLNAVAMTSTWPALLEMRRKSIEHVREVIDLAVVWGVAMS